MKNITCVLTVAFLVYVPLLTWTLTSFYAAHYPYNAGTDTTRSISPMTRESDGHHQPLEAEKQLEGIRQRMEYLENKVNAYLSFAEDPFRGMTVSPDAPSCRKASYLEEYHCKDRPPDFQCVMDHNICLDDLLPPRGGAEASTETETTRSRPCVVYDFGIRDDPAFGEVLAGRPFLCDVFAFDPSPITAEWYKDSPLRDHERYRLFPFGAGGIDGDLKLREYNWGQITILQYPQDVVDPNNCDDLNCRMKKFPVQHEHRVPVRTLKSVMSELGHDRISVLKLDVEGSEYQFLEAMIEDLSCLSVDQLSLEWHHHGSDPRYGVASSPHINMLVSLLEKRCGLYQWWVYDPSGGWPAGDKLFVDMGITLRYNLVGFRRKTRE